MRTGRTNARCAVHTNPYVFQFLMELEDPVRSRLYICAATNDGSERLPVVKQHAVAEHPVVVVSQRVDWRPTRLRFGEVLWSNGRARLQLRVGNERPFVPTFFREKQPPRGRRKAPFPRDQRELVIATAWRMLDDGQSVLIYCPERRSIKPYADAIIDLASKGCIGPALNQDDRLLADALTIGREWLGDGHPILGCLKLGVAIHHGALPTPFRKEMERLLRDGVLKVTVSSPTLAQGLNLTATTIIMHAIEHYRDGKRQMIEASDFKNVVGRAGRAFVDVEGLVLFPIFDRQVTLRRKWDKLIENTACHEMESGLLRLVIVLLTRLNDALGKPRPDEFLDYVLNNAAAWEFPTIAQEKEGDSKQAASQWHRYLAVLDTALLSLIGEEELSIEDLSVRLDELLSSSLWQRQVARHQESAQALLRATLEGRAKVIWAQSSNSQRRGYFLAGVGLASGQALDALAAEVNPLLVEANGAILARDRDRALGAILRLATRLFAIEPFVPDPFPEEWRFVLELWLKGELIARDGIGQNDEILLKGALSKTASSTSCLGLLMRFACVRGPMRMSSIPTVAALLLTISRRDLWFPVWRPEP